MTRQKPGPLSTKAKRAKMAKHVEAIASKVLGIEVKLEAHAYYPDEVNFRLEGFETARGRVSWLEIGLDEKGVDVHIKFSAPQFAPGWGNPNRHSGKWNHYIWHGYGPDDLPFEDQVGMHLRHILSEVRPSGATRQNLPDLAGYWEQARQDFAATLEARKLEGANA